jgi:hypothetical protein
MNVDVQLLTNYHYLAILPNFDEFEVFLVIDVFGNQFFFPIDYDVVPTIDDEYVIDERSKFRYFLC